MENAKTATLSVVPANLETRVVAAGRLDVAGVRAAVTQMHQALGAAPALARVRHAMAIALLELDRAEQSQWTAITKDGARAAYRPLTVKRP